MESSIIIALLMGLTGSLHCAGMCGPIALVMPFQAHGGIKKWIRLGLYHLGRISVYALLGFILFSFRAIFHPEVQQYISILLGAVLIIAAAITFFPQSKIHIKLPWTEAVKKQLGKFMLKPKLYALFITGMLNGLLPCGLVYIALALATSANTPIESMMLMYAFGTGTLPIFVLLLAIKNKMKLMQQLKLYKLAPVVMFLFGCLFVIRGMNLGIPYLSPEITITQHSIKTNCCHKH